MIKRNPLICCNLPITSRFEPSLDDSKLALLLCIPNDWIGDRATESISHNCRCTIDFTLGGRLLAA